jgi:hypothetical protein
MIGLLRLRRRPVLLIMIGGLFGKGVAIGARTTGQAPTVSATEIATSALADTTASGATGYLLEGLVRGFTWILVGVTNAGVAIGFANRAWLIPWLVDGATLVGVLAVGVVSLVGGGRQVIGA